MSRSLPRERLRIQKGDGGMTTEADHRAVLPDQSQRQAYTLELPPSESRPPAIEVHEVSKSYQRHRVLDRVSFALPPGKALAVIGANGCGKSTLLKICAGLLSPSSGRVVVRGRLGYCPQALELSPYITANNHFTWFGAGQGLDGRTSRQFGAEVAAALDWQVPALQTRHLSGGTQQKLSLACTMESAPDVILLDEPYQGFDSGSYIDFWALVDQWCAQGCAVIVVTHLLHELHRVDAVLDLSEQPPLLKRARRIPSGREDLP